MKTNLEQACNYALNKEFAWLEDFENPYREYEFSRQFQRDMDRIVGQAEYTYVSLGRRRLRKSFAAILIALLVLAATGCAVITKYIVEWNETQNDKQGTLDVSFDVSGKAVSDVLSPVTPTTPEGFTVTNTYCDEETYTIEYSNETGELIMYCQDDNIENMGLSIDNEDAVFEEVTINGYKGYSYFKDGLSALFWADGINFYTLQGTCDMKILETMTENIIVH